MQISDNENENDAQVVRRTGNFQDHLLYFLLFYIVLLDFHMHLMSL